MGPRVQAFIEILLLPTVMPALVLYLGARRLDDSDDAFCGLSEYASRWAGRLGILRRRLMFRLVMPRCGRHLTIHVGSVFTKRGAVIGDNVYIGQDCSIGLCNIGDNTLIADHVSIPSGKHVHGISDTNVPIREQAVAITRILIGADCWIGSNSVILADVNSHAVVGAGSVVTHEAPAFAVVAGNPARILGDRRSAGAL